MLTPKLAPVPMLTVTDNAEHILVPAVANRTTSIWFLQLVNNSGTPVTVILRDRIVSGNQIPFMVPANGSAQVNGIPLVGNSGRGADWTVKASVGVTSLLCFAEYSID